MERETESHQSSSHDAGAASRHARRAERADQIEAAGLRLFARAGYDAVSAEDVAAAAGVSRATFFRYFRSKEDIVFANHPREAAELVAALRRHPRAGVDRDEMAAVLAEFMQWLATQSERLEVRVKIVDSSEQLIPRALRTRSVLADTVAGELAGGGEPTLAMHVLAAAMVTALLHAVRQGWHQTPPPDMARAFSDALQVVSFRENLPGVR